MTFKDARVFRFKPLNFPATYWAILDGSDQILLRFLLGLGRERQTNELKTQVLVELIKIDKIGDLLLLLISFGFYLILMNQQEGTLTS